MQCLHRFLAADQEGNVIEPKDTSISEAGGIEMTELDKKKLSAAYSCDNPCGGRKYSATGGEISKTIKPEFSDKLKECEYNLRTDPKNQIVVEFSVREAFI